MVSIATAFELSALPQGFMAERDGYIRDELTQRIWSLQLILTWKHTNELEEQEVLDSRAQQSRLSSRQFAGINLVERKDKAQQSREMGKL